MLVVTTRLLVRTRLRALADELALPAPTFLDDVTHALEESAGAATLLIDLGSCAFHEQLEPMVRAWSAYNPAGVLILLVPLLDRERELETTVRLARTVSNPELRVMTSSDFHRIDVWRSVQQRCHRTALHAELRDEFIRAVCAIGRPIPAEPLVLDALVNALHGGPRPASSGESRDESRRKTLWKQLRKAGQLPPSRLELVFQILWYAKLKSRGWNASRIAQFMGFREPREFRMMLKRRLGIGMSSLNRIGLDDALSWAATVATLDHSRPGRTSVREMLRPLLRMSAQPLVARDGEKGAPGSTNAPPAAREPSVQPEPPALP